MFAIPEYNLDELGLSAGSTVVDLGAGSGAYAIAAAKKVSGDGKEGKVYAVDVQKNLLDKIKNEANKQHITNIEVIWGNIEKLGGTKLRDATADVAIASNILFQVEDRQSFIKEAVRVLKPNGRLFLIDWSESFGGIGPHGSQVVTKLQAQQLCESVGFVLDREVTAGSHHYGLIFHKKI